MIKPSTAQKEILILMACNGYALFEQSKIVTYLLLPGEDYWISREIYLHNKSHRISKTTFAILLKNGWIAKSEADSLENKAVYFISDAGAALLDPAMEARWLDLVDYIKKASNGKRSLPYF